MGKPSKAATTIGPQAWVAVGSGAIDGVVELAAAYADLVDATRTAQRLGARGWIPDPQALAVERLLLTDRDLADAAVRRELGPLLADDRMGAELIDTLQAYFDAGESIAEAARRLHLATRTVSYRMDRVVSLLGRPLDGESRRRLSVALLIYRLRSIV
jgi:DNA-binding PucR family transcriptional regulator